MVAAALVAVLKDGSEGELLSSASTSAAATSAAEFTKDITRTSRADDREIVDEARDVEDRQRWWQVGLLVMLVALAGEALVGRRAA